MWSKLWSVSPDKYEEKGDALFKDGNLKEARLEYLKAFEMRTLHQMDVEALQEKINAIDKELIKEHESNAKKLSEEKEYIRAAEELEFLLYLYDDEKNQIRIRNKIEEMLDKAGELESDRIAEERYERGIEFLKVGDESQAFIEMKEAYNIPGINEEIKKKISEKLSEIEEKFAEAYIKRAEELEKDGITDLAKADYERALSFLDFNKDIKEKVIKKIEKMEENSDVQLVSDKEWENAYNEFRMAMDEYLCFDYKPVSYWFPYVVNPNLERYLKAKNRLGDVYYNRAVQHEENKEFNLALKLYHEALSYFTSEDDKFHNINKRIIEIKKRLEE